MDKRCGNCGFWRPEILKVTGTLTRREADDWCTFFDEERYGESRPKSWCWKPIEEGAVKDGDTLSQV